MRKNRFWSALLAGGLTWGRLWRAASRRITSLPHALSYSLRAGPRSPNRRLLRGYASSHTGERCFILGNGPSLRQVDLSRLQGEVSFGLNRIYLIFQETAFRPSYFVCMNDLVIEQSVEAIHALTMPRFLNWRARGLFRDDEEILYLRETFWPHFSKDIGRGIWGGATVTYAALQIANYMGFEQVVLLGVDHSYSTPGPPHQETVSHGADRDHFSPTYFPDGFRWHLPDLATAEYAYRLAREAFESDGRQVLDATIGGRLKVFPKVDLDTLLA